MKADITARRDVAALREHNPELLLGRQSGGTLRMKETSDGLQIEIDPPDDQVGRSAVSSVWRGDLTSMSFGFVARDFTWVRERGGDIRVLKDVELFDVSVVTFPAFPDTSVATRSLEVWSRSVEFSGAWETRKNKVFLREANQRWARDKLLRDDSLPHTGLAPFQWTVSRLSFSTSHSRRCGNCGSRVAASKRLWESRSDFQGLVSFHNG